jgi:hypothetical protein
VGGAEKRMIGIETGGKFRSKSETFVTVQEKLTHPV